MEIPQERIQEWFENDVTKLFFKEVQSKIAEIQQEPRFKPNTGANADDWALFNGHLQGKIEGLEEVESVKENMLEVEDDS